MLATARRQSRPLEKLRKGALGSLERLTGGS